MGGLVVLHSGQGILVVRLRKVSKGGYIVLFCFIVCYSLNMVLFYLKNHVCAKKQSRH